MPSFNTATLFFRRLRLGGVAVGAYTNSESRAAWNEVVQLLSRKGARPLVDGVFPFDQLPAALLELPARLVPFQQKIEMHCNSFRSRVSISPYIEHRAAVLPAAKALNQAPDIILLCKSTGLSIEDICPARLSCDSSGVSALDEAEIMEVFSNQRVRRAEAGLVEQRRLFDQRQSLGKALLQ